MKKTIIVFALLNIVYAATAQDEDDRKEKRSGFKKENLFIGGDINLGFGNNFTALGASPYFGYSINRYLDAAVSLNFNYTAQRDYVYYGDRVRQTVYGPGTFIRVYPIRFLFVQAQYEHNFIKTRYIPADNSPYIASTDHYDANSFLVGAGYAGGRDDDNKSFYYISISMDLIKNKYSPYVDGVGRAIPIIRAGYNIALFQGRR